MASWSTSVILLLYDRQNGRCAYCGDSLIREVKMNATPHVDHVEPNGCSDIDNLCLACAYCNFAKNCRSAEHFRRWLEPYLTGEVASKRGVKRYWEDVNEILKYF